MFFRVHLSSAKILNNKFSSWACSYHVLVHKTVLILYNQITKLQWFLKGCRHLHLLFGLLFYCHTILCTFIWCSDISGYSMNILRPIRNDEHESMFHPLTKRNQWKLELWSPWNLLLSGFSHSELAIVMASFLLCTVCSLSFLFECFELWVFHFQPSA